MSENTTSYFIFSQSAREDAITKLLDDLFSNYDKRLRPGVGNNEPLKIQVNAYVMDLFDVDENNHVRQNQ
jgi:hypothetical protein